LRLEETDRKLAGDMMVLHNRFENSLITLTNNVNNLTEAIRSLQETQSKTTELQHSLIRIQERSSSIPDMQREVTSLTIATEKNNVVLQGIKYLAGTVLAAVIGLVASSFWGG
jgi:DNA-binding ferritin-like protein